MKLLSLLTSIAITPSLVACSGAMRDRAASFDPAACYERQFNIYFEDFDARLSPGARRVIETVSERLRGCRVDRVRIVGLADAPGDPNENMQLSEQRALTVATYLQSATDWPRSVFELVARGDRNATTPEGLDRPMRRRATVTVMAVAPPAGD